MEPIKAFACRIKQVDGRREGCGGNGWRGNKQKETKGKKKKKLGLLRKVNVKSVSAFFSTSPPGGSEEEIT